MVLPFISAVMRDVFETVPDVLKESAYGLGATTWEVIWKVVVPYSRTGIVGGIMLGLGRALGETMAVTFVIGNAHRVSASLLAPGTTISASIANEFTEAVGDLYTSSLVALGVLLFLITFTVIAAARLMLMRLDRRACRRYDTLAVRKLTNAIALGLSGLATARRADLPRRHSLDPDQQRPRRPVSSRSSRRYTPPPGDAGGLLNAIYGSVVMTRASAFSSARRSACSPAPIWPNTGAIRGSAS